MKATAQLSVRKRPQSRNMSFESVHGAMKLDMAVKPKRMTFGFMNWSVNPSLIPGTFSCSTFPFDDAGVFGKAIFHASQNS